MRLVFVFKNARAGHYPSKEVTGFDPDEVIQ